MNTKFIYILFCLILISAGDGFSQENFVVVNTETLNWREEPSTNSRVLTKIKRGEILTVIDEVDDDWVKVSSYNQEGYVSRKYLVPLDMSEMYSNNTRIIAPTGEALECSNITVKADYSLENYLLIRNETTSDAVIKLIDRNNDCIRMAFVKRGDIYKMKNIPQEEYTLRVAYGKRLSKTYKDESICYIRFLVDPEYTEYTDVYNYRVTNEKTYREGGYDIATSIPSYEVKLYLQYTFDKYRFNVKGKNGISEEDFNR